MTLIQDTDTVLGSTTIKFDDLQETPTIEGRRDVGEAQLECSVRLTTPEVDVATPYDTSSLRPTITAAAKTQSSSSALQTTREAVIETRKIRLTAVKGTGFSVRKRMFKKDDIPDVYLNLQVGTQKWKTSVIPNSTTPQWNESKMVESTDNKNVISVEAYDKNKGTMDADDFYGSATITIGRLLLSGGTADVELQHKGEKLGLFITLRAELVQ
eukprot:CAMPEP_0202449466 /NCGR_PEP_ID=MMETSP1360-20130828/8197_1 /ASSEMBLY_ACC=CAM_ASM_000848 /TAXON_ID=515479 /ORGANISM="Licmophora paradoxa, Strain CCMP2313" /LENGTH=212 /DNA_ID=CAMNT_0049067401 /DNA_START=142 /DNA_END=780 /DNA_ORIENTATION=-